MKSLNYILLLLDSGKNQGIALLETSSPQQVVDLVRVLYNLNTNKDLLPTKAKSLLTKNKNILNKLFDKKISEVSKYRLIRNNAKTVFQLLGFPKNVLLKALKQVYFNTF